MTSDLGCVQSQPRDCAQSAISKSSDQRSNSSNYKLDILDLKYIKIYIEIIGRSKCG